MVEAAAKVVETNLKDLDKTFEVCTSQESTESATSAESSSSDVVAMETMQKEMEILRQKLLEKRSATVSEHLPQETIELVERHKDLLGKERSALANTKRIYLQKQFAERILERSSLIAGGTEGASGQGNEKIQRFGSGLNRRDSDTNNFL